MRQLHPHDLDVVKHINEVLTPCGAGSAQLGLNIKTWLAGMISLVCLLWNMLAAAAASARGREQNQNAVVPTIYDS